MAEATLLPVNRESALARLDPQALITRAIESGTGIDVMERLVALAKDVREVQAREAWYEAMAEFQRRCPTVKKTTTAKIQTRGGASYSYRYAPLDEILSVAQPVMGELGLSASWRSKIEPDRVIVACRISHTLGHHEESGDIAMPIVSTDGAGANPAQRVGIALTYAKRYALLGILGLAPEDDDDGGGASGRPAAPQPADEPDSGHGDRTITEPQQKRLHAIASGQKWSEEALHFLLSDCGVLSGSSKDVPMAGYEAIVETIKRGPTAYEQSKKKPA